MSDFNIPKRTVENPIPESRDTQKDEQAIFHGATRYDKTEQSGTTNEYLKETEYQPSEPKDDQESGAETASRVKEYTDEATVNRHLGTRKPLGQRRVVAEEHAHDMVGSSQQEKQLNGENVMIESKDICSCDIEHDVRCWEWCGDLGVPIDEKGVERQVSKTWPKNIKIPNGITLPLIWETGGPWQATRTRRTPITTPVRQLIMEGVTKSERVEQAGTQGSVFTRHESVLTLIKPIIDESPPFTSDNVYLADQLLMPDTKCCDTVERHHMVSDIDMRHPIVSPIGRHKPPPDTPTFKFNRVV
ncbi:hypothetical protein P154DRAFT_536001 [Amniculicola lignicola CBS 123094]|uniref:Uncharacterized protein n=1 Tax=Amniculicola lignicola CBS 123094 TaxID=1392246 RepID=A0A6A5WDE3_9PLEO|nr:hypothetical protein P154DRAFT_536001 [Amniculicola lignicola CBS 123094]